ncbi:NAD(P)-dependent alcohol dehydrogenase [Microbacterium sp. CFH 90308]|uniref:NAD(P)-dependent alcohol dehydrogenase n=2 Tax=Microbacterium salsuginis TaxID=2722803 RepID=A0ABX1K936_9MICO|nr:NAD(P)-dependent alcohol dehydrogenase [Microbacterium sp. CFH 90308]NLP83521.1 NAD(P)-dependent alcohol dehydrogenase [Microbacterium sp. CFH 90308]
MPEPSRIEIVDREVPAVTGRQALIRTESVGVCGSDTTYFTVGRIGDWVVRQPMVLGHEVAGSVIAVGGDVTRVRVGDRVAIEPGTPCRDCEDCTAGDYHLCADLVFLATPPHDGALTQFMVLDERNLFRMPDDMSFDEGAMLEPLSVGIWACRRAGMRPGERVLVSGAGPVGILAAQVARAFGAASVRLTDLSTYRLDLAAGLGFDVETVGSGGSHPEFDVLLECSGAPSALADGLWRLRNGGRAAMVGMPKQSVELPLSRLNARELSLALVNRYAHTWPTAMSLVASGRVDAAAIVTHHFSLDDTADALMLAKTEPRSMKAVIHPQH